MIEVHRKYRYLIRLNVQYIEDSLVAAYYIYLKPNACLEW